jgi:phage N-6-adenine-methyltransferase
MQASKWTNDGLFSSKSNEWGTPEWLVKLVEDQFGEMVLDVAASEHNSKGLVHFNAEDDAIATHHSWNDLHKKKRGKHVIGNVWCNPPYGRGIGKWMERCVYESFEPTFYVGNNTTSKTVFGLVFARTDTRWFHDWVVPWASMVYFIKGRLKFEHADGRTGPAPAPSMLVVWDGSKSKTCRFATICREEGIIDPHHY